MISYFPCICLDLGVSHFSRRNVGSLLVLKRHHECVIHRVGIMDPCGYLHHRSHRIHEIVAGARPAKVHRADQGFLVRFITHTKHTGKFTRNLKRIFRFISFNDSFSSI